MKGDFSRVTFRPERRYSQVLFQQGQLQVDADWNEEGAILLHRLRAVITDIIGSHGTPPKPDGETASDGFKLVGEREADFAIGHGHYYVNGVLCENPRSVTYSSQADNKSPVPSSSGIFLAYLDVWERDVTHVQDSMLRDPALGSVDGAMRAQVVWQVRLVEGSSLDGNPIKALARADIKCNWEKWTNRWQHSSAARSGRGRYKARRTRAARHRDRGTESPKTGCTVGKSPRKAPLVRPS